MGAQHGLIHQQLQDIVRGAAAIKRIDHGLNDGDCAVIGSRIRPHLEVVRSGNVPVRDLASLVEVRAQMCNYIRFIEGRGEVEIGRRGVDGIGVENHQPIDFAGIEIGNQGLDSSDLVRGQRIDCVSTRRNRFAHIAQHIIDGQRQSCDRWILIEAGNHCAFAGIGFEVPG